MLDNGLRCLVGTSHVTAIDVIEFFRCQPLTDSLSLTQTKLRQRRSDFTRALFTRRLSMAGQGYLNRGWWC
jgi:hypothetical protein